MKKFIIGILCGALLMVSGQVMADQISRVGKKVGSEATVTVDGTQVSDAIIVDGKSYAPLKDIVEEFNGEVKWIPGKDGERNLIEIKRISDAELVISKQRKVAIQSEITEHSNRIESIEKEIIPRIQANIDKIPEAPVNADRLVEIEKYKQEVKDLKAQITTLESELKDIDNQIAELQQ